MSASAIRDGLYATLTACGPYSAAEVSACSFDVLEGNSACAIVFLPGTDTTLEPFTFAAPARQELVSWNIEGGLYIRMTGDPQQLLGRVWQGHDDLRDTINSDNSLASSACAAFLTRLSFNRDFFVEIGGHDWALVEFTVRADEF